MTHRRCMFSVLVVLVLMGTVISQAQDAQHYLQEHGRIPADYVLSKFKDHRVVLIGEHHWVRHDAELVVSLLPRLQAAGASAVAVEMFRATDQAIIDETVNAERWDRARTMKVMRTASWPYEEYLEIIHAVWRFNQGRPKGARPLRLLAIGPDTDWRKTLLPLGQTYDTFMAKSIEEYLQNKGTRVLVYSGANHAFTRYYQPELPRAERVERFMQRMGNVLWRDLGEDVFMITLHRPWQCRAGSKWGRCLPLDGAIDCAAAGKSVGFDVTGSPFADTVIPHSYYFGLGYPKLRFSEMADGYIWTKEIGEYQGVHLIPLAEFAPDAESLVVVAQNNPFSDDKGRTRAQIEDDWQTEAQRLRDFAAASGWNTLFDRENQCGQRAR